MNTQLTERQQFKLQEFIDFATMDMHPIVPEVVLGVGVIYFYFQRPNQPASTKTQIALEMDTIFENDILVSREIFKKVFQDSLSSKITITENIITLLIPLDRPFTTTDRINRTGLSDFMKVLRDNGWADNNDIALKEITIQNEGFDQEGVSYIKWTATLMATE